MKLNELKGGYDRLLKDSDFDKLELGLKNPNIFQILNISKNEIRHSNFLAWLLNPQESHKLNDIFLKRFLREVFSSEKFSDIDQVDVEGLDLSKVEIYREWRNIDVLIKLENVIVCIENKVLSKEHSNQLNRYKQIVDTQFPGYKRTFVYLNPEGIASESEVDNFEPISYEFIVDSLDRIISVYGESLNDQVKNYINDYITIIKRELMGTDQLTELSKKIYLNHKALLDFIFEHKPEEVDELSVVMKEELSKRNWIQGSETKYYIRFLTEKMHHLIYCNEQSNGWKNKESFLFEIRLQPAKNKLLFTTVISPSDSKYNVLRLQEMLLEIDGFRTPYGQKWRTNYDQKEIFPFDDIPSMDKEDIRNLVNILFDKISPVVEIVEYKLLENEDELIEMKSV